MKEYDLIVIGAGMKGILSAAAAYDAGIYNMMLFEKEEKLGGFLRDLDMTCGSKIFKREIKASEYIDMLISMLKTYKVPYIKKMEVTNIDENEKSISLLNGEKIKFKSIIIANNNFLDISEDKKRGIFIPADEETIDDSSKFATKAGREASDYVKEH